MPSVTGSLPTTCVVFGQLFGVTGGFIAGANVAVELEAPTELNGYLIPAMRSEVSTGASGEWQMNLMPLQYAFNISYNLGNKSYNRKFPTVIVPNQASANFTDLVEL